MGVVILNKLLPDADFFECALTVALQKEPAFIFEHSRLKKQRAGDGRGMGFHRGQLRTRVLSEFATGIFRSGCSSWWRRRVPLVRRKCNPAGTRSLPGKRPSGLAASG